VRIDRHAADRVARAALRLVAGVSMVVRSSHRKSSCGIASHTR
jgi:hypothetical protein